MMITAVFENIAEMVEFADTMSNYNPENVKAFLTNAPDKLRSLVGQRRLTALTPEPAPEPTPAAPVPAPAAPTPVPMTQATVPTPEPAAPAPAPIPTSTVSYTVDDLTRAAMPLMDAGRQGDLIALLKSFGVDMLPALPQDKYGAFATALRAMGAQI